MLLSGVYEWSTSLLSYIAGETAITAGKTNPETRSSLTPGVVPNSPHSIGRRNLTKSIALDAALTRKKLPSPASSVSELTQQTPRKAMTDEEKQLMTSLFDLIADGKEHFSQADLERIFGGWNTKFLPFEAIDKNQNGFIDRIEWGIYVEKLCARMAWNSGLKAYLLRLQQVIEQNIDTKSTVSADIATFKAKQQPKLGFFFDRDATEIIKANSVNWTPPRRQIVPALQGWDRMMETTAGHVPAETDHAKVAGDLEAAIAKLQADTCLEVAHLNGELQAAREQLHVMETNSQGIGPKTKLREKLSMLEMSGQSIRPALQPEAPYNEQLDNETAKMMRVLAEVAPTNNTNLQSPAPSEEQLDDTSRMMKALATL